MEKKHVYVVAGPTASGKSDFAVTLALEIGNAEILSVDSRQIFKGLDSGTGKITIDEMKGVKHHMLDVYDVNDENINVVRFRDDALIVLNDIFSRGKTPILCGGSGQYLDALLYEKTFAEVAKNNEVRKELESKEKEELVSLLLTFNKEIRDVVDTKNKVRLVRALEIYMHGGSLEKEEKTLRFIPHIYLLNPEKEKLHQKIRLRMQKRLEGGMIDEVKNLLHSGVSNERLIALGLEYKYIMLYLLGKYSKAEMLELLTTKSFQYAKRQVTWNKKYLPQEYIVEEKK